MGRQVVKDDNGAGIENRCELNFDIGVERQAVQRAGNDPRGDQRVLRQSGDERLCPPFTEGSRAIKPLADRRTPAKAGEIRFDRGLVYKDQPVWLLAHPRLAPRDPVLTRLAQSGPVTFGGDQSFFYMTTRRDPKPGAGMRVAPALLRFRTGRRPALSA